MSHRAAVAAAVQLADIQCQTLEIKAALRAVTDENKALKEEVASLKQKVETLAESRQVAPPPPPQTAQEAPPPPPQAEWERGHNFPVSCCHRGKQFWGARQFSQTVVDAAKAAGWQKSKSNTWKSAAWCSNCWDPTWR